MQSGAHVHSLRWDGRDTKGPRGPPLTQVGAEQRRAAKFPPILLPAARLTGHRGWRRSRPRPRCRVPPPSRKHPQIPLSGPLSPRKGPLQIHWLLEDTAGKLQTKRLPWVWHDRLKGNARTELQAGAPTGEAAPVEGTTRGRVEGDRSSCGADALQIPSGGASSWFQGGHTCGSHREQCHPHRSSSHTACTRPLLARGGGGASKASGFGQVVCKAGS